MRTWHKTKYNVGEHINDSFTLVRNYCIKHEYRESKIVNYEWLWECRCNCGKTFSARESTLKRRIGCMSCTHCKQGLERSLRKYGLTNLTIKKRIYKDYKIGAAKRGLEFKLTFEDFLKLMESNCFYCGAEPIEHVGEKIYNQKFATPWRHNGIDRVNTKVGYTLENCVPCCSKCNYAKHDMSVSEFTNWVKQIYNNLFIKSSTTIPKGSTSKRMEMGDSVVFATDEDIVSSSSKDEAV